MKRLPVRQKIIFVLTMLLITAEVLSLCPSKVFAASTGTVTASALNVRKSASTTAATYGCIYKGASVSIEGTSGSWYKVTAKVNGTSRTGYVHSSYVSTSGSSSASGTGTVNVDSLNVRSSASTSSSVLGVVSKGTSVTIKGTSGSWYNVSVKINGSTKTGYVYAEYITKSSGSSSSSGSSGTNETPKSGTGTVTATSLNVRSKASTTASVYGSLSKGAKVTLVASSGSWYKVKATVNGNLVTGYVHSDYISVSDSSSSSSSGSTSTTGTVNVNALNVRSSASTSSTVLGSISKGTTVTITGTSGSWYKVTVKIGGNSVTGYVYSSYITKNSSGSGSSGSNSSNDSGSSGSSNTSFETSISEFPESYKSYLRELHNKYPDWEFKAIKTGLDWNTVIAQESVVRINTYQTSINSNTAFSYLSTDSGAYDWSTDKYTLCDGSNWYSASSGVISYYMDPRNFLTESKIFQFESLAYDSSQTKSVVSSILGGTFMSGNYTYKENGSSVTKSYASTFVEAGKAASVSPYFLAARSRQELGTGGTSAITGTHSTYPGYYNYFNIGASDGSNAIANGLYYASGSGGKYTTYGRPWNTPYKAIVGGAKFLGESYINIGQNTLYFQKFNVVYKNALYRHQYMTNVQAASSEASTVYTAYKNYGALNGKLVFYIPVYNNMPSSACSLPAKTGNPNSYLKSLTVKSSAGTNYLTPTFNYKTKTYDIVVPNSVNNVTVGAAAVSSYAKGISGTGSYSLTAGSTKTVKVTCTAGNGSTTTYTVNITRKK